MLSIVNISKSYKSKVLDDISFDVEKGSIVCIAGRNGSGKSTLLKIIASLLKPDSGEVRIYGQNVNEALSKKHLGFVSQKNSLFEDLTVSDNIKFFTDINGRESVKFNFDSDILNKKISQLSDGMRKRVNIMLSLINNPDFLIMDEPTANLDIYFKKQISEIILEYKRRGKSIIFTSHDTEEMLICDKLYVIRNGKFVFGDNPKSIKIDKFADIIYDMIKN